MQQTLLIQIFRMESSTSLSCSTCSSFSRTCCQVDSGWQVLSSLVATNSRAVWSPPLTRAVNSLRLQGYVCPGILVTATDDEGVSILRDHWTRHALAAPPGFRIFRLGLSTGCSVTPFAQGPSPSLSDAICAVLASLKRREKTANMENILQGIQTDFRDIPAPKDFLQLVHKTLGGLIKARRVYYTGKGYFLVVPDKGEHRVPSWEEQFQKFVRPGSSHPPAAEGMSRDLRESAVQTEEKGDQGSCSSFSGANRALPLTPQQRPGGSGSPHQRLTSSPHIRSGESPHQTPPTTTSQSPATPNLDSSGDSREESPRSPMERSQSFRINKKAQKLATKGGSLRLSKKDAAIFKDDAGDTTTVGKNEDEEEEQRKSPTPKKDGEEELGAGSTI